MQLVIDGSGNFLDISVFNNDKELIYCLFLVSKKTHSQRLISVIDDLLKQIPMSLEEIDRLYCVIGPGRHTSTRVVISTLKGLFFERDDIETFEVNSLDLAAAACHKENFRVMGEMFSKEAYYCDYSKHKDTVTRLSDIRKATEEEIKSSKAPIIRSNDPSLFPKTRYIFKIEKYINKTDIFSMNPFY